MAAAPARPSSSGRTLNPAAVAGAAAKETGAASGTCAIGGGASIAGRTHPGAGACAALLAAAAADAQTAALELEDPRALSATHGLSDARSTDTAGAMAEDVREAAVAGEAKPNATITKPVVSLLNFERFTSGLPCIPTPFTVDFTQLPVDQRIWVTCVAQSSTSMVDGSPRRRKITGWRSGAGSL